jgi:hypothetical protein
LPNGARIGTGDTSGSNTNAAERGADAG